MAAECINVVMSTYVPEDKQVRAQYAASTAEALFEHLTAPVPLRLILADDGSFSHAWVPNIMFAAYSKWRTQSVLCTGPRAGLGGSLNRALTKYVKDDLWMYITDDWLLTAPLDLSQAHYLLHRNYDLVRIGPIHPWLHCQALYDVCGWRLDLDASEDFAFATRPFVAAPSLVRRVGPFNEGVDAYYTEKLYSDRCKAVAEQLKFAYDGSIGLHGPWLHIGDVQVGHDPIVV